MTTKLKEKLKKIIGLERWNQLNRAKEQILTGFKRECYSQEGEDLILWRYFAGKINGFYVDVGAHHPTRFSNTQLFYKNGWRGINIDAMPGSMKPFHQYRRRDINLEIPVASSQKDLKFSIFSDPALNGFVSDEWIEKNARNGYPLIEQKNLTAMTLAEILDKHLPSGQTIDFMSIDVEGLDLDVFNSNNWNKYRPEILVIETESLDIEETLGAPLILAAKAKGYRLMAKTINSWIFRNPLKGH